MKYNTASFELFSIILFKIIKLSIELHYLISFNFFFLFQKLYIDFFCSELL
jgi:hypothetical protein